MKFMLSLVAFGYVALANPTPSLPVNPGGIGGLFKGPNSEIIIKGPDGSVITAAAEGGEVQTNVEPILVAEPAIQAVAPVAVAAAPVAIAAAPVIEAVPVPASVVESKQSSDLIGPSGRIATQGSQAVIAGPASTTVTGPAIVAETVVKGPPLIGAPVINAATPLAIGAVPVAVTASPVAAVAAAPYIVTPGAPISIAAPSIATITATPAFATVTATPQIAVTAAPQAVATAAVSSAGGVSLSASAAPNQVDTISTVTATTLPVLLPNSANGLARISNQVDLTRQVIQDQLAIDNRQINLNPALIPSANIIPPEIAVTPRLPVGRLRPTPGPVLTLGSVPVPGTLLTTPGLGAVGAATNIQREEGDTLSVTPNGPQVIPQATLTPQQITALQSQQALLNNQIQQTQNAVPSNILRDEVSSGVTPNTLQINSQVSLSQNQLLSAIQNRQILLNNQIQHAQLAAGPGTLIPSPSPTGQPLFTPNIDNRQVASLANVAQQNILSAELAKSGVDASQVQLTNVPLSAVSGLPLGGLKGSEINGGSTRDGWGRFSRDANKEKKADEKKKSN